MGCCISRVRCPTGRRRQPLGQRCLLQQSQAKQVLQVLPPRFCSANGCPKVTAHPLAASSGPSSARSGVSPHLPPQPHRLSCCSGGQLSLHSLLPVLLLPALGTSGSCPLCSRRHCSPKDGAWPGAALSHCLLVCCNQLRGPAPHGAPTVPSSGVAEKLPRDSRVTAT